MIDAEAYLIARMQVALLYEGVLHHPPDGAGPDWIRTDGMIIRRAVVQSWDRLSAPDRVMLWRWGPGTTN